MYVVVENTPGYVPENDDPATFETLAEAQEYARGLAREVRESLYNGRAAIFHHGDLWEIRSLDGGWDLGRVVEVMQAEPAACAA